MAKFRSTHPIVSPSIWTAALGVVAIACAFTGFTAPPSPPGAGSVGTDTGSDNTSGLRPQVMEKQDELMSDGDAEAITAPKVVKAKKITKSRVAKKKTRPERIRDVNRDQEISP